MISKDDKDDLFTAYAEFITSKPLNEKVFPNITVKETVKNNLTGGLKGKKEKKQIKKDIPKINNVYILKDFL